MFRIRAFLAALVTLLFIAVPSCDAPTAPNRYRPAAVSISPRFAQLVEQAAAPISAIRVTAKDDFSGIQVGQSTTTVDPQATSWQVRLDVGTGSSDRRIIVVSVELISLAGTLEQVEWSGTSPAIQVFAGQTTNIADLVLGRGPLSNQSITSVEIGNVPEYVVVGDSVTLTASAQGASATPVFFWSSLDTTKATVDATGKVHGISGGSVGIVASAGAKADTATIAIRGPSNFSIASGDGQTGVVDQAVEVAPAVRVTNADEQPVANLQVTFAVASGGGSIVGPATVTTNANGIARVQGWKLGTIVGVNTLTATLNGFEPLTFTARSVSDVPGSIVADSGNAQSGAANAVLPQPLVVRVTDKFGNPVIDAQVGFAPAGETDGTVGTPWANTDSTGRARSTWTLGTATGPASVTATVQGLTPVTFTATALAGAGRTIVADSGNAQTGTAGSVLPAALVVRVRDEFGNAVPNVSVAFATTSGTVGTATATTDGQGRARTTWTLGTVAGAATLTATVQGVQPVTFTATVQPGPVSAIVADSGNAQTAPAGSQLPTQLVVHVRDQFGNSLQGVAVTFTASGGNVSVSSTATDAQGRARTRWTLGQTVGAQTVTATVQGVTPETFTATATAGAANNIVADSGNAQSGVVGSQLPTQLVVKVNDQFGNGVPNVAITFTASGGTLSASSATTNAQGRARTTWTLGQVAGPQTVTATLTGGPSVIFDATARAGAAFAVVADSGNTQSATAGSQLLAPLVVRVVDQFTNPISGATVTFTPSSGSVTAAPQTNAQGRTRVTWTLGQTIGPASVTASVSGATSATFTATIIAGAANRIAADSGNAQTGTVASALPTQLVVRVTDQFSNPVAGAAVTFAPATGSGSVGTPSTTTDAQGRARTAWTLGQVAGSQSVVATVNGVTPLTFTATAVHAAAAAIVADSGNAQIGAAGAALPIQLVARIRDQFNNPVSGLTITFTPATGSGSVSPSSGTTDALGRVRSTWTLGTVPGSMSMTASASGLTSVSFNATATAAGASAIVADSGNTQSGTVASQLPVQLVVLVRDQFNNPVPGASVTFAPATGSGTVGSASTVTNTQGRARTTWTLGTSAGGQAVTATVAGASPVTFTATALPGPATGIVADSGNAQSGAAGSQLPIQLVARVTDQYSNPVQGITVSFAPTTGSGSVSAGSAITDAQGRARVRWTLGQSVGAQSVTAQVQGIASVNFTATATAGAANNIAADSGNAQSGVVAKQLPVQLVAKVVDQFGNAVPNVAITFTPSAGSVSAGSGTTDAQGRARTLWTLGQVAGTQTMTATTATGQSVVFDATARPDVATAIVADSGTAQTGQVGAALTNQLVVRAHDQFDNAVPGVSVTSTPAPGSGSVNPSTPVATDANGRARVTWTLGQTPGTHTVTASATGLTSVSFSATANVGPVSAIVADSGDAQTAIVGAPLPTQLVVRARDQFNNPVSGVTVTFAPASGNNGSVNPSTQITTDANGRARAAWTLGTVPGTMRVNATAGTLQTSFTATAGVGPATALVLESGNGQSDTVGVQLLSELVVRVHDQYDNPISGVTVTFAPATGSGTAGTPSATTDATGHARTTWTLGNVPGSMTLTASTPSLALTPLTFTATAMVGAPAGVIAETGSGQSSTVGSTLPTQLVALVRDALGNPVPNISVTFTPASGSGSVTPTTATTDAQGRARTTWTLGSVPSAMSATATAAGFTATFAATATVGAPASIVADSGNAQTGSVGAALTRQLVVRVLDPFSNPVPNAAVTFTPASGSGSTGAPQTLTTDGNGRARTTWTLGTTPGAMSVEAKVGTLAASFTATANAGAANSITAETGSGQTGTVGVALPTQLVALVLDAFNNPVPNVTVTFTPATNNGTASPTSATTNVQGRAATTWTLGQTVGPMSLTAATAALTANFSATGTAAAAATIAIESGNGQSGVAGTALPNQLVVIVRDQFTNLVPNASVTFAVPSGDGSVSTPQPTTTDANGRARTTWTLGDTAGPTTVTATIPNNQLVTFSATIQPGAPATIIAESGNNQTGTVGAALPNQLVALVRDSHGNPVPGLTVTFTPATGEGTANPTSATTDGQGRARTTWTLGQAPGSASLAAMVGTLTVNFSATASVGQATAIVADSGNAQSATVNTALTQQLVVAVRDQFGNPISGVAIAFTTTTGNGSANPTSGTTGADGKARTIWTLGTKAGPMTLTASSTGLTSATFTANAIAGAATAVVADSGNAQTGIAGSQLANQLVARVHDQFDNPVAGVPVTFAIASGGGTLGTTQAVNTDANGRVRTTWTLGTVAGAASVTATAQGIQSPATFTATINPAAAASITAESGNAQTGTVGAALQTPLVAVVHDQFGNPVPGIVVTFATTTGNGTPSPTTGTTDASGRATTTWTLGTTAGPMSLSATAAGVTTPATFTATAQAAAAQGAIVAQSGSGQTGTAGAALPNQLVALVRDQFNNPVAGVAVTFTPSSNSGTVNPAPAVSTDAQGLARVTWTLGQTAGTQTVTASANGLQPATFTATANAGAATAIVVSSGDGQTGVVGTQLSSPIVALVHDQFNNPVSGIVVTFTPASGSGSASPTTATTNAQGLASTAWTLGTTAGPMSLSAAAAGVTTPATFTATAQHGAAAAITAEFGNGQSGVVGLLLGSQIGAVVRDQYGNPIPDVTVNFSTAVGSGSVSPASATTDAQGRATTSWTLGVLPGLMTLTATAGNLTVNFTATAVVGAAGSINIESGNNQAGTVNTSLANELVVVVRDILNNPVPGVNVTFAIATGGGSVSAPQPTTTDANGRARTSWVLGTVAGTGSVTATAAGIAQPVTFTATANPASAAAIVVSSGNNQTGTVNTALGAQIVARVNDQYGNPVPNIAVTFTPASGSVGAPQQTTTGTNGLASTTWTLGTVAGAQSLTASLPGISNAVFNATAQPGPVSRLAIVSGNGQSGPPGTALPNPLVVRAIDTFDNSVPNVAITFTPSSGSVNPPSASTNAAGQAQTVFTPGTGGATQTVSASAGGNITAQFTASVSLSLSLALEGVDKVSVGGAANVRVTLPAAAPSGGVTVTFGTSNSTVLRVGAVGLPAAPTITIAQGATSETIDVHGLAEGTANVTASATGYTAASLPVAVETRTITVPATFNVQVGGTASMSVTLARPAPSTGTVVSLSSTNTQVVTVPASVTIPSGQTTVNATVTGLALGSASIIASSPNYTPDTAVVTALGTLLFVPQSINYDSQGATVSLRLTNASGGPITPPPGVGLTVLLTSANPSCASVSTSVFFGGATSEVPVNLTYPGTGQACGTTQVVAEATGFVSDTLFATFVAPPGIMLDPAPYGYGAGLQREMTGKLTTADHQGTLVHLKLSRTGAVLAKDASSTGEAELDIQVPAGQASFSYYVQSTNAEPTQTPLLISATASGFTDGTVSIAEVMPVLEIMNISPDAKIGDPDKPFWVRIGAPIPDRETGAVIGVEPQAVRVGGSEVALTVTTSSQDVGRFVLSDGTITGSFPASIKERESQTAATRELGGADFRVTDKVGQTIVSVSSRYSAVRSITVTLSQ